MEKKGFEAQNKIKSLCGVCFHVKVGDREKVDYESKRRRKDVKAEKESRLEVL